MTLLSGIFQPYLIHSVHTASPINVSERKLDQGLQVSPRFDPSIPETDILINTNKL